MNVVPYFSKRHISDCREWTKKCKEYDLISLDIYGTSLIRLVASPEDVFFRIEKRCAIKDFANKRKKAQDTAIEKLGVSATIYDIYDELEDELDLNKDDVSKIIQIEIEEEKKCSIANSAVIELIKECKIEGKTVVFTSDMYLPSGILSEILKEKGLKGFDDIIVSCECGLSKGRGDLFAHVYNRYKDSCKRFIHIGDGRRTDFLNARLSRKFSSALVRISRENAYEKILMYGSCNKNIVYKWAFDNMGGIMYAFCQWIDSELLAGKYKKAVFLTREGAYIKGFFDLYYKGNYETNIFYVSRRSIIPAMADFDWNEFLIFLKGTSCRIGEFADVFGFSKEEVEMTAQKYGLNGTTPIVLQKKHEDFLESLRAQIVSYACEQRKYLVKYMKQLGLKGNIALVDIGWRGTMQADLQKIADHEGLGIRFIGLYLGEYDVEGINCQKKGFLCSEEKSSRIPDVINATYFLENALLMPIGTTKRYYESSGRVFPETGGNVREAVDRIKLIQEAMKRSFGLICEYRGYVDIDAEKLIKKTLDTTNNPTYMLACELGDIPWYDLDTVKYIAKPDTFGKYLRSPKKIVYDMQKSGNG